MQPDRFTIKSQEALQAAQRLADERRNPQTTPEHLLAVLLEQDGGVVVPVLRKLGVDPAAVRQALSRRSTRCRSCRLGVPRARRRLERARPGPARRRERDARAQGRVRLDRAPDARDRGAPRQGRRCAALYGATHEELLKALAEVRGSHRVTDQNPEEKFRRSSATAAT